MRSLLLRKLLLAAASGGLLLGILAPAGAVPIFARKYGFECTMCHSAFPRLNDWGQRYRQNGYQIPGKEREDESVSESATPVSLRAMAGFNSDKFSPDGSANVSQLQVGNVDLLSAGLVERNLGYFLLYRPQLNGSRGVVAQPGTLEMANVVFSHLAQRWLNLRLGRMEPAVAVFSPARHLSVTPYEVYDFTFPGGPAFSDTQTGLEVSGWSRTANCQWATGWLNGSDTNKDRDTPADWYARVAHVFGRGEGQTTGQRVGLVGYWGQARPLLDPDAGRQSFNRWGADASLNLGPANLALQYLRGSDNARLWGTVEDVDFSGGFAELTYQPAINLVGFARWDTVSTPDEVTRDVQRWTLGGRYYFSDQLAGHLEYSHRTQDGGVPASAQLKEDFFTARLDAAF